MAEHNNLFSFTKCNSKLASKWWFYFRKTVIQSGIPKFQFWGWGRGGKFQFCGNSV